MKFDVDDKNRCRLVRVKFHLNRCRFAVAVVKCLGGSLFWFRRKILLARETRQLFRNLHSFRSPFLGSGMNVENVHSSGHSPVSQIATHILRILSNTVCPPALNSSAGTSSGPVALRLAVWGMAWASSNLHLGMSVLCSIFTKNMRSHIPQICGGNMQKSGTNLLETNYAISFHRGPETWIVPFQWQPDGRVNET